MKIEQLKQRLSTKGNLLILKEGVVFTLLMTGIGLSKADTVQYIQQLVLEFCGDKFPFIEAMRNDEEYFCMILKPSN